MRFFEDMFDRVGFVQNSSEDECVKGTRTYWPKLKRMGRQGLNDRKWDNSNFGQSNGSLRKWNIPFTSISRHLTRYTCINTSNTIYE